MNPLIGAAILYPDNTLGKWVNGEWIVKPSVQLKDLSRIWTEDANPDDIDTRYYNRDGSKKS